MNSNKESMTPQELFGLLLKNSRKINSITQQEVAEQLYISRSAYTHYENGLRLPSLVSLVRICSYIGADPATLLLPLFTDKSVSGTPHPNVRNKKSNSTKLLQKDPVTSSLSSYEQAAVDSFIWCLKNLSR